MARRAGRIAAAAVAMIGIVAADLAGSVAEAKFLRNSVRPGDAGEITFLRAPPQGSGVRLRTPGLKATPMPQVEAQPRARQDWFWAAHSPAASAGGADRWTEALATMRARRDRGQTLIGEDRLRAIKASFGPQIRAAADAHDVSEALLIAVIAVESAGKPTAISPKNAQGLMQLIPATAARFGITDPFDPGANVKGGAAYLDWLLGEFRGDLLLALAGYNAGEGAVHRHKGVPPYAETRDYVVLVLDALAGAGALCDAPISGPRQRCRWETEV